MRILIKYFSKTATIEKIEIYNSYDLLASNTVRELTKERYDYKLMEINRYSNDIEQLSLKTDYLLKCKDVDKQISEIEIGYSTFTHNDPNSGPIRERICKENLANQKFPEYVIHAGEVTPGSSLTIEINTKTKRIYNAYIIILTNAMAEIESTASIEQKISHAIELEKVLNKLVTILIRDSKELNKQLKKVSDPQIASNIITNY